MKSVGQVLGGSIKFRRDNRAMINEKTEGVLEFLTSGSLEGSGDGPLRKMGVGNLQGFHSRVPAA